MMRLILLVLATAAWVALFTAACGSEADDPADAYDSTRAVDAATEIEVMTHPDVLLLSVGGACAESEQCESGVCLTKSPEPGTVGVCAGVADDCPEEWVDRFEFEGENLCAPPADPEDWASLSCGECDYRSGLTLYTYTEGLSLERVRLSSHCLSLYGNLAGHCAVGCPDGSCPEGYECEEVWAYDTGEEGSYCVPLEGCPILPGQTGAPCDWHTDCDDHYCLDAAPWEDSDHVCSLTCMDEDACGQPDAGYHCGYLIDDIWGCVPEDG